MPKIETQAVTFIVDYVCDKCDTWHMFPTGKILLSDPPKFPHVCNHCGADGQFEEKYPAVISRRASPTPAGQQGGDK